MSQQRYLQAVMVSDALALGKMAWVSGPRQVGKSTMARRLLRSPQNYYLYDDVAFRRAWTESPATALADRGPGPVVLDEIHKDRRWKTKVKGLYDQAAGALPLVVTGSARLDIYRRGGDSLLGRYLPYRLHPFSVAESTESIGPDELFSRRRTAHPWEDLLQLGGFPEPLLGGHQGRAQRWSRLRLDRLVTEDARDLRAVADLNALRILVELLPARVGSLLSIHALHEDVGKAYATVRAWVQLLDALYYSFLVRPYAGRLQRSLRAEPKLYLFDILQIPGGDRSKRLENLTALHLLKACQYWTDIAQGEFDLRFVRTKDGREVDFLLLRDRKPWMLIECKSNQKTVSQHLLWFQAKLRVPHVYQLIDVPGYDREYVAHGVRMMGYDRFFAGWV